MNLDAMTDGELHDALTAAAERLHEVVDEIRRRGDKVTVRITKRVAIREEIVVHDFQGFSL